MKKKAKKKTVRKVPRRIVRRSTAKVLVEPLVGERVLFNEHQTRKKERMIIALSLSMGTVQRATKQIGISRKTHYNWMRDDPEYKQAVEDVNEDTGDFVEYQMLQAIREKQPAMMIFYAKTKLKHRGYVERQELTGANGGELKIGGALGVSHCMNELPPAGIANIVGKIVGGGGKATKALNALKKKHSDQQSS